MYSKPTNNYNCIIPSYTIFSPLNWLFKGYPRNIANELIMLNISSH